ncbi:hypothetical protein [Streptomyces fagopyri]
MFYALLTIGLAAGVYAFVTGSVLRRTVMTYAALAGALVALVFPGRW